MTLPGSDSSCLSILVCLSIIHFPHSVTLSLYFPFILYAGVRFLLYPKCEGDVSPFTSVVSLTVHFTAQCQPVDWANKDLVVVMQGHNELSVRVLNGMQTTKPWKRYVSGTPPEPVFTGKRNACTI